MRSKFLCIQFAIELLLSVSVRFMVSISICQIPEKFTFQMVKKANLADHFRAA